MAPIFLFLFFLSCGEEAEGSVNLLCCDAAQCWLTPPCASKAVHTAGQSEGGNAVISGVMVTACKTSQLAEQRAGQSSWRCSTLLYTNRSSCVPALALKSFKCTLHLLVWIFSRCALTPHFSASCFCTLLFHSLINSQKSICALQTRESRMPICLSGCPLLLKCADSSRKCLACC